MTGFEILDHTADIGIKGWGEDIGSAFISCAQGLFYLVGDKPKGEIAAGVTKDITSFSWEELLVEWLNELVYEFDVNHYYLYDFCIGDLRQFQISSRSSAIVIPKDYIVRHYIKAVTYYGAFVRKMDSVWVAQVIIDV